MRGRDPQEWRDELRRQRARAVLYIFASSARRARILACDHPGRPDRVPSLVSTADTRETSRVHQSKEGTRSRSNAASAQVNNAASYNSVPSNVLNAAYEAGLAGAKVHRLKRVRAQLQRHHPDLDLRGLAPEVLFKNRSPADIDALDEATSQATIDEWKRANGIGVVSNAPKYKYRCSRCGQIKANHVCPFLKDNSVATGKKAPRLRGNHPRAMTPSHARGSRRIAGEGRGHRRKDRPLERRGAHALPPGPRTLRQEVDEGRGPRRHANTCPGPLFFLSALQKTSKGPTSARRPDGTGARRRAQAQGFEEAQGDDRSARRGRGRVFFHCRHAR